MRYGVPMPVMLMLVSLMPVVPIVLMPVSLTLVVLMLAGVGLAAWVVGFTIVKPLARLTEGATRVGAGDLQVDIPVAAQNEVGYLTEVFNEMVGGLRAARESQDLVDEGAHHEDDGQCCDGGQYPQPFAPRRVGAARDDANATVGVVDRQSREH